MKRTLSTVALCVWLTGCAYSLALHPRDGGSVGTGVANSTNKTVQIMLDGRTYQGTYTFDGGSTIFSNTYGSATGRGGSGFGSSFGSAYVPGSGNGRIFATAGSDGLRCEFQFKDTSGLGVCQDNAGKFYDLMIRMGT